MTDIKYGDDISNGEVCPVCRRGDEAERKLEIAEKYLKAIADLDIYGHRNNMISLAKEAIGEMEKI